MAIETVLEDIKYQKLPVNFDQEKNLKKRRSEILSYLMENGFQISEELKEYIENTNIRQVSAFIRFLIKNNLSFKDSKELEDIIYNYVFNSGFKPKSKIAKLAQLRKFARLLFKEYGFDKLYSIKLPSSKGFVRKTPPEWYFRLILQFLPKFNDWLIKTYPDRLLNPEKYTYISKSLLELHPTTTYNSIKYAILFQAFSGARTSEVLNLTKDRVDFNEKKIVLFGKGKKLRIIEMSQILEMILKKALSLWDIPNFKLYQQSPFVFARVRVRLNPEKYSHPSEVMDALTQSLLRLRNPPTYLQTYNITAYWNSFFNWLNKCPDIQKEIRQFKRENQLPLTRDIDKIVLHQLRHLFATKVYSLTRDIVAVKEWLGHSDLKFTQFYVKQVNKERIKKSTDLIFKDFYF